MTRPVLAFVLALLSLAPRTATQIDVELTTAAGATVTGQLAVKSFKLDTDFGSATIESDKIAQIELGARDAVTTVGGLRLEGVLAVTDLRLKTGAKTVRFTRKELTRIVMLAAGVPRGGSGFAGEWATTFGPMRLAQQGTAVTGSYGFEDESKIEGKVDGRTLQFGYRDANGRGTGSFELWEDDEHFTGGYEPDEGAKGKWGAYRIAPRNAEPKPGAISTGQSASGLNYHLRVPAAWDGKRQYPAIAFLHGSNMSSRAYVETIASAWPKLADDYVLAGFDGERISGATTPENLAFNFTYINFSGPGRGPKWVQRQSPALVAEALEELGKALPIRHWFVGGHSQGGFLTYAVALYYPDRVAGAFPMSCNLLVQCEPDFFADEDLRARQRRVAFAPIHGENDQVVPFSGGRYCHARLVDGGFPRLHFFTDPAAAHMFARLPVEPAVRWLEAMTSDDAAALVELAEERIERDEFRDATAALQRARELAPEAELRTRLEQLEQRVDAAAQPKAGDLQRAIEANRDGSWVDDFLAFRRQFAFAAAAAPVMAAYAKLRAAHAEPAESLFRAARQLESKEERNRKYGEIVARYYASKWYEHALEWMK